MSIDSEPCSEEDREIHRSLADRFARVVSTHRGISEAACRAYVRKPEIAVRFEIHEVYLQTPGPCCVMGFLRF